MTEFGPQLEREASRVDLAPGAFDRFDRKLRRRVRIRKIGVTVVVLALFVLSVFSVAVALIHRPQPGHTPPPSVQPSGSAVLPPGTYWTAPLTRQQLIATLRSHGFGTSNDVRIFFQELGPFTDKVRFGISVRADGLWHQFEQRDGLPKELGWAGAYRVARPHQIEALGYGCTITYSVERTGADVVIRVLDETGVDIKQVCGRRDLAAQTVIYDTAPFTRN